MVEGDVSGTTTVVLNFRCYALSDLDTPISTHTRSDTDAGRIQAAGWCGVGRFASSILTRNAYTAFATGPEELPVPPWQAPVSFAGTIPAQSFVEDSAITPLDLSGYFSGALTPFTYAVTTGTLPTGLALDGATGIISGTPTTPAAAVSIVVTATDTDTNTAASNAFNITITDAGAPPAGTVTISAVDPGETTAEVTYSYDDSDQTGFEYRIDGGAAATIGASPATITGLTAATEYDIEVMAINAAGASAWSSIYTFTTDAAPVVVKGIRVTTNMPGVTGITAMWWDSNPPTGNPVFTTASATTDGSGVLEIDLDATTTLALAAVGTLALYKLDGTDHRDSLGAISQLPIVDIA
ncbi:MAG TPA: putative Ig domain-containing protein [Woeseiaceae bacterium]